MADADPTRQGFDEGFAHAAGSAALRAVMRVGLPDLPDWLESFNFVPAAGLREVAASLKASAGDIVLDLACGLGGPGLFVAEATSAQVIGVDWSTIGVTAALRSAVNRHSTAAYVAARGDLLPLADACVDAVMCIDAIRFLPGYGLHELRRVMKPRARVAITAWERDQDGHVADFASLFEDAGFDIVSADERPEWQEAQRRIYEAAAEAAAKGGGDQSVVELAEEGVAVAPLLPTMRRVLVVAQQP